MKFYLIKKKEKNMIYMDSKVLKSIQLVISILMLILFLKLSFQHITLITKLKVHFLAHILKIVTQQLKINIINILLIKNLKVIAIKLKINKNHKNSHLQDIL